MLDENQSVEWPHSLVTSTSQYGKDSEKLLVERPKAGNVIKAYIIIAVLLFALQPVVAFGAGKPKTVKATSPAPLSTIKECADCPTMVRLPPMTYSDGKKRVFYAARTELTWREYAIAARENGCASPRNLGYPPHPYIDISDDRVADDYPIIGISVYEHMCYLDWIRKKTGKTYRLPTGEEWEYLARAGVKTRFPWGDELGYNKAAIHPAFDPALTRKTVRYDEERLNVRLGAIYPVAKFSPNAWGLYDVIGNAEEAVADLAPIASKCTAEPREIRCRPVLTRGGDTNPKSTDDLFKYTQLWITAEYGFRLVRDE